MDINIGAQRARAKRRARLKVIRLATFVVIALIALGTAGYQLYSAFVPRADTASANTIDIKADMGGFSQNVIWVKAGEEVTLRLISLDNSYHTDGGGKHQWAVDELGISVIAPPKGSNAVTFTPNKAGTYTFYCDICCGGRANPTMQGKLIIEA